MFFGIPDCPTETWVESEGLVQDVLSRHLKLQIPDSEVSRAHRLGSYTDKKTRPIIIKFSSSKVRDAVWAQKHKLKGTGVSASEDFCRATRNSRRKLTEFAKVAGQPYSLRMNKLIMNKKRYVYCAVTDSVRETDLPRSADTQDSAATVPARAGTSSAS